MTNQEINERIAAITGFHDKVGLKKRGYWYRPDACGYTSRENEAGRYTIEEAHGHVHYDGDPVTMHRFTTPNYAESLDACREFSDKMSNDDHLRFQDELVCILPVGTYSFDEMGHDRRLVIDATPLQRCEAFLRLKGQWE